MGDGSSDLGKQLSNEVFVGGLHSELVDGLVEGLSSVASHANNKLIRKGEREKRRKDKPSGEGANVTLSAVADVTVGIDGSLADEGGEDLLVDAHAMQQGAKELDLALAEDLDAEETVGQWVDHHVRVVELTRDRRGTVITLVLSVHNVHDVVSDVSFLFFFFFPSQVR